MPELLLELFSEEIPARMQARAAEELARLITDGLKAAGLSVGKVDSFVAPRRLAVVVADVPAAQADVREERRGPRVGAPDQAIQGFLKSTGLASLDQCEQREIKGATYYFAVIEKQGGETLAALPAIVGAAIKGIAWPKSMRWASTRFTYVRPLHNILCRFGGAVVPGQFDCGGGTVLEFSGHSFGHRILSPGKVDIASGAEYRAKLRQAFVVADRVERRALIGEGAKALAAQHDLTMKDDPGLLDEVAGLVEWPVPLLGKIDSESMALPPEVLVTSMRAHQKYFALETPERAMAPHFLVVANMTANDGGAAIVAGNERVLRARLADARFFWNQDRKATLASRVPALDTIVWNARLGTVGEKAKRIAALAVEIARHIPGADEAKVRRAALLCKADLTTGMVGEFPELQGVMGRYYARHDGEDADVATAIAEHWGPLGPNDTCPKAPVSVTVALADKIDTLLGYFSIGDKPTGSKDPYALRRAALGVIRLLLENSARLRLAEVLDRHDHRFITRAMADKVWPAFQHKRELEKLGHDLSNVDTSVSGQVPSESWGNQLVHSVSVALLDFFADRLKVALREKGVRHDLIDAVFALGGQDDFVSLLARVDALRGFIESDDGKNLLVAYKRAANIVKIEAKKADRDEWFGGEPNPSSFILAEEKALGIALDGVASEADDLLEVEDFAGAMRLLAGLRRPVDAFFEKVTVNVPEKGLRSNRLALLRRLAATMDKIADFARIEG